MHYQIMTKKQIEKKIRRKLYHAKDTESNVNGFLNRHIYLLSLMGEFHFFLNFVFGIMKSEYRCLIF